MQWLWLYTRQGKAGRLLTHSAMVVASRSLHPKITHMVVASRSLHPGEGWEDYSHMCNGCG